MADIEESQSLSAKERVQQEKPKLFRTLIDPRKWRLSWPWIAVCCALLGAGVALLIALPAALVKHDDNNDNRLPVLSAQAAPVVRHYYVSAELQNWTYVPEGVNLCALDPSTAPQVHVHSLPYQKAVYKAYTDATFSVPLERDANETHMGLLGPVIRAEVGDTIHVVFKNKLTFPVNIEPSGVSYSNPMHANPGDMVEDWWIATEVSGPTLGAAEKTSKLWLYRSTVHTTEHSNAGLLGPIIITAKGSATPAATPKDVDQEFVVVFQVLKEDGTPSSLREANAAALAAEELHAEFHAVNGYLFCNLKGLVANTGSRVRWHVAALGSTQDVHTAHWHGVTLDYLHRRTDLVHMVAGATYSLDSMMDSPGSWLLHCHVNSHLADGMAALFTINGPQPPANLTGRVREYFVAAEMHPWNYAPLGGPACSGSVGNFTAGARVFLEHGEDRIGAEYLKAQFIEYTDGSFTQRKERPASEVHLGFLGPLIRAVVGDTIKVTLKNMVPNHPISMHPHGVRYDKGSEGAPYNDGSNQHGDDSVQPGSTYTYTWLATERAGPAANDPSSLMWMYHSHTDEIQDTYAGLVGAIIITQADMATESAMPKDVDTELVLYFTVMDETSSFLLAENLDTYLNVTDADQSKALLADEGFLESNLMHSINGYMFCNGPGLNFLQGSRARFHVMALGDSVDMHTPAMFGTRFTLDGQSRQSLQLLPGSMLTTDVHADTPGLFGIKCKVNDHLEAGMAALLNVAASSGPFRAADDSTERRLYIAAELVEWDYAPLGFDGCSGLAFDDSQKLYTEATNDTVGSRYLKAVYRQYTDWTFTTKVEQPDYQGLLGPTIHAEVGDTLVITLLNRLDFAVNLQPAGGLVLETPLAGEGEGSGRKRSARKLLQAGGEGEGVESPELLSGVEPGKSATFTWSIPPSAGPMAEDTMRVVAYTYISTVNEVFHTHAGLVGLLLVAEKGGLTPDGRSVKGVDRELPVLLNVYNELETPLMDKNLEMHQNRSGHVFDTSGDNWEASHQLHAVNGYIWCNQPSPVVKANSTVLVVMAGMGSEDGMHGVVFTGQTLVVSGRSDFAPELMPSITQVAVFTPQGPGYWEYYCEVTDHYDAGMRARLRVEEPPAGITPALTAPGQTADPVHQH